MAFDEQKVREIADRVAASGGLEIADIEFHGAGKHCMLRVFIDRPGAIPSHDHPDGVTHEHCANFSREFGTILDVEDVMPGGSYLLEVSSPGLDRKLSRPADFERFTGSRVKVMTRQPVNGSRHFEGRLESFQQGRLTIEMNAARKKPRPGGGSQKLEIELANA